jgi:integrase
MKVLLTDRFVAGAKANGPRAEYFDTKVRGLSLRVSPGGVKSWSLHYTGAKRSRVTLGSYPSMGLAAARGAALEARAQVEAGADPRRSHRTTVATLIASYLDKHVRPNLRTADDVEGRFNYNALPIIGNIPLADLHRRDINRVIDPILTRGRPISANHVFQDLRAMLRWAVARGDLDRNPMDGMTTPAPTRSRERVLTDAEIAKLWAAIPMQSADCQRIVKLCLITAQRVGEVTGMTRSELDLKAREWRLPGSRTKNKHPHTIPLSDMALAVIDEALGAEGRGELFAIKPKNVGMKVSRLDIGDAPFSPHDLRRTALTGMAKLGVAPIVLGHIANHRTTTKAGMTLSVYVHHAYEKEKREALELWADRLRGIIAGGAEVVPIHG